MMTKREKLISSYPIPWDNETIIEFRCKLLQWYDHNKRELPWRQTRDPYKIWVSEIMLQQTQVDTVKPYYQHFITQLPTIKSLAEAPLSELMQLWQGLGYYSRVRNMQIAAQQVMNQFEGEMPNDMSDLLTLKGIGPYTAGAIASIAFNQPEPALDGNLMRIVSRLFEIDQDISKQSTKNLMMSYLYQLIDPIRPGDFNQALMDLGATIHTPSNYDLSMSPIKEFDQSYRKGTSHLYPVKRQKIKQTQHQIIAYVIKNPQGEFLMRQHQDTELLQDLWHFPLVESQMVSESVSDEEILDILWRQFGQELQEMSIDTHNFKRVVNRQNNDISPTNPIIVKHVFSHRIWNVELMFFNYCDQTVNQLQNFKWISAQELTAFPISTLQCKLLSQVIPDFEEIDKYISDK